TILAFSHNIICLQLQSSANQNDNALYKWEQKGYMTELRQEQNCYKGLDVKEKRKKEKVESALS
ncbi:MAG: hypothetical protein ACM3ME_00190, partial [Chloroflexota bacterium]